MTTIAETLNDISQIQEEFNVPGNDEGFVKELMNFTTVIYFEYLSHVVLDNSRNIDLSKIKGSAKYYELWAVEGLLSEYIRINNIGHFSFIWNAYEKYLRTKYHDDFGLTEFKINKLFEDLIDKIKPANRGQIVEEFEVMRNTRNSLHDGGIYNANFNKFKGKLRGNNYEFTPGDSVTPLRIMDVIAAMWSHYKEFEKYIAY